MLCRMDLDDALREGFRAAMAERSYRLGKKINAHALGRQAKRSSAALYAWLGGRSGMNADMITRWLRVLGVSTEQYLQKCLAIAAARDYKGGSPPAPARTEGANNAAEDSFDRRLAEAREDLLAHLIRREIERIAAERADAGSAHAESPKPRSRRSRRR